MYNEYEAPELMEVGNAKDVILGEKDVIFADSAGLEPTNRKSSSFAEHED